MFDVKVTGSFNAAHNLRGYKGKCEKLHGHNWKVEVCISSRGLNKIGIVEDFSVIKNKLGKVTERLDHSYINDLSYFKKVNPTSENISKYIYDLLRKDVEVKGAWLSYVAVWETENSCAVYKEDV